jgi:hypothetical protein
MHGAIAPGTRRVDHGSRHERRAGSVGPSEHGRRADREFEQCAVDRTRARARARPRRRAIFPERVLVRLPTDERHARSARAVAGGRAESRGRKQG